MNKNISSSPTLNINPNYDGTVHLEPGQVAEIEEGNNKITLKRGQYGISYKDDQVSIKPTKDGTIHKFKNVSIQTTREGKTLIMTANETIAI